MNNKKPIRLIAILLLFSCLIQLFLADGAIKHVKAGYFAFPGYHQLENGVRSGYGYEFLTKLQRYTQLAVDYVGYENSWKEMQQMLLDGKIDFVTSARKTLEREKKFDFSMPIGINSAQINVRINDDRFIPGNFAALNGITIGLLKGNTRNEDLAKFAAEKGFTYKTIEFSSAEELQKALLDGKVDAIGTSSLRRSHIEKTIAEFAPENFYVIVRKGDTALLNEINYGIDQMDANEGNWRDDLKYKYYAPNMGNQLLFTERELAFIKAVQSGAKKITVTSRPNRAPYTYTENGVLTGIIPDYFARLMARAGLPYTTLIAKDREEYGKWQESNHADVFIDYLYDSNQPWSDDNRLFTRSYMELALSRVTRKGFIGDANLIAKMLTQQEKEVAELAGRIVEYLPVDSAEEAMTAVQDGKADACYVPTFIAERYINWDPDANLSHIILKAPVYYVTFCINPNMDHELCSILNKCIMTERSSSVSECIAKYTNVTVGDLSLFQLIKVHSLLVILVMGILMLLIVLIAILVVKGKTKERKALIESNARFFALEDNFEALYDVNLETSDYDVLLKGQTFTEKVNTKFVEKKEFFEDSYKNIDRVVYPEDRDAFKAVMRRENILKALATKSHFDYHYRLIVDGEPAWFRMRIVYKDSKKKDIIIGIFNASQERETQQIAEQKEQLEIQQKQLKDALAVANAEKRRNEVMYEIIHAGKWSLLVEENDKIIDAGKAVDANHIVGNYVPSDGRSWLNIVHPDDRKNVSDAFEATIKDHSCKTPYDVNYRIADRNGNYRWLHAAGRVIRNEDKSREFFGILVDISEQMEEQQKRLLGAMPLSNDVLTKANIGLWAFELDEGQPPRMYDDETMLRLVGLDHQISPEEAYHAWYDHIDEGSYDLVTDAVNKMISGEHAEVQYPWHFPDGRTIVVRCGGVRNPEYTKGIRIEGTHQDVTQTLHFDEKERQRAKQLESDLLLEKLRADSLAFISDNEPNLDSAISFFGNRILEISGCDQVVYRELGGRKIVLNVPGNQDVPEVICSKCPFAQFDCAAFTEDGTVLMNDCKLGYRGYFAPANCPAKSSYMQMVSSGGKIVGKLTVHFLQECHEFSENEVDLMKTVAVYLGIMIGRIKEKQAEIARKQAELSNKAKSEFLFNMSHDIRTPMNAIIGFTDKALKHKNEPQIFEECLGKVKSSSEYLLRIVNDILDMAKIESGKLELHEELHFGNKGSNTLIEVFGAEAARKGIEFHASYDVKDKYFWVDKNRANQIVANIISNAIKYTDAGGDIWYSVKQLPCDRPGYGKYVVSVEDTGKGMSPEFLEKVFEAFSRDISAIRSGAQGTGLGMAIVKKLVDAMGGTIDIQSELGKGTKVSFTMEHRLATPEEINACLAAPKDDEEEKVNYAGKRVLLVEDNELNREIAIEILSGEGLVVEEADDGTKAVELLKTKGPNAYDFILMDIQMPIMNGYEATQAIRAMYPDAKIPIIALSANAFAEDKQKSLDAGMNDHVAKPIKIKELFTALAKFL